MADSVTTILGFIVAVGDRKQLIILQEPACVDTEEFGWWPDERGLLEGEYDIKPGVYKANYLLEKWYDSFHGAYDAEGQFVDFELIYQVPERVATKENAKVVDYSFDTLVLEGATESGPGCIDCVES